MPSTTDNCSLLACVLSSQRPRTWFHILLIVVCLCWIAGAHADTVLLHSGERLVGKLVSEHANHVVFKSKTIGEVQIKRSEIQTIQRDNDADVHRESFTPAEPPEVAAGGTPPDNKETPQPVKDSADEKRRWWMFHVPRAKHGTDWIQLTSGEWLRGRLNGVDNFEVDFESDKLHELSLDWKDIEQIYAPYAVVSYGNQESATGTLRMGPSTAVISGTRETRIDRNELYRIAPSQPREIDNWRAKLNVGMNLRAGNTEQIDLVTGARVERRSSNTYYLLNYSGNFGKLDGETNTDNHRVNTSFDYSLSRRLFVRLPLAEYFSDPFQNISHRVTVGGGIGYQIFDEVWTRWSLIGGPGYQHTWYDSVQAGTSSETSTPALVIQTSFERYLTPNLDLELGYQGILTSEEAGRMSHHTSAELSISLTRTLDLDLTFIWDRTENPQTGADGVQPEKNDVRLSLSLGVEM